MTAITLGGVPRVNLMPQSETARRERARLSRRWVWGAMAAVLVALILVAGASALKWVTDQMLVAEQAQTQSILADLAALSEVSEALATEAELSSFSADAMGADFAWAPVMASVAAALPEGVTLSGLDVISGGTPQAEDPTQEIGMFGVVELQSPSAIDMPATIRALRNVPGVSAADGQLVSTSLESVGAYTYEVTVTFDQSIYSGAFGEETR